MAKHNVEYDFFKTLKQTNKDELYYTILKILNGKYRFQIEYLNDIPLDVILVYLEKFLVVSSGFVPKDEKEVFESLINFIDNIDKISFRDINSNFMLNVKYNLEAKLKSISSKVLNKKTAVRITSFLLFATLLMATTAIALDIKNSDENLDSDLVWEQVDSQIKEYDSTLATEISDVTTVTTLPETTEDIVFEEQKKDEPAELTLDEAINIILEENNLTVGEFDVVCAIVMAEAKTNSYEDSYAVINTIYNRITSKTWVNYISSVWGEDVGGSLYYQAITSGQFVVYENGRYVEYLGVREGNSFQAIIDFLITKDIKHDYLSFKSSNTNLDVYEQFVNGGNKYHNPMPKEDRIIESEMTRT